MLLRTLKEYQQQSVERPRFRIVFEVVQKEIFQYIDIGPDITAENKRAAPRPENHTCTCPYSAQSQRSLMNQIHKRSAKKIFNHLRKPKSEHSVTKELPCRRQPVQRTNGRDGCPGPFSHNEMRNLNFPRCNMTGKSFC